jgi:SAM-dependent methyltransferase
MEQLPNQEKIWDHFQNEGVDSFSGSEGRLEFLAQRLLPGTRVLNIGIGNGALETMALAKGVDIWSLDPSERAVERLRQRLGLGEKFQCGYSQEMPFPENDFDVVVMSEVLEHLEDKVLYATLDEVCRVLRPGGKFIGTVPARENLADLHIICPQCGIQFHRWGHVRSFSVETLSKILARRFVLAQITEWFFIEWHSVGWWRRVQGLVKKFLSWRNIGTYGTNRNIFFCALKPDSAASSGRTGS